MGIRLRSWSWGCEIEPCVCWPWKLLGILSPSPSPLPTLFSLLKQQQQLSSHLLHEALLVPPAHRNLSLFRNLKRFKIAFASWLNHSFFKERYFKDVTTICRHRVDADRHPVSGNLCSLKNQAVSVLNRRKGEARISVCHQ